MRESLATLGFVGVLAAMPALAASPPQAGPQLPPTPQPAPSAVTGSPDPRAGVLPRRRPRRWSRGVGGDPLRPQRASGGEELRAGVRDAGRAGLRGGGAGDGRPGAGQPKLNFPTRRPSPRRGGDQVHPASPEIHPDITTIAHTVAKPSIVTAPSSAQIQAAYPERALSDQVEGRAAMDCLVLASGKLAPLPDRRRGPAGYGFGQATLDLAGDFLMKPRLLDGEPTDGAMVRLGVNFSTTIPPPRSPSTSSPSRSSPPTAGKRPRRALLQAAPAVWRAPSASPAPLPGPRTGGRPRSAWRRSRPSPRPGIH